MIVKVDFRQQKAAQQAKAALENVGLHVFNTFIPLLSAFDKAENQGAAVIDAVDDKGRSDPRRMSGWSAYCSIAQQIQCQISKHLLDINKPAADLLMSA